MAVNGKQKGASFERQICKDLSRWVSNGQREDLYWRSAMSGGRSTVAMKKGEKLSSQAGDISSVDPRGHALIEEFVIECKTYKTLNYESMIKGKGKLLEFWRIAKEEAFRYNKEPILIAKQNMYPIVACLTLKGVKRLGLLKAVKLKVYDESMYIVLWDDFLAKAPTHLRRVRL